MRFFYVSAFNITGDGASILPAAWFVNDRGEAVDRFPECGAAGYCNLYINGVMQGGSLYDISPSAVTIRPMGQTIAPGTPIIVESVSFQTTLSH